MERQALSNGKWINLETAKLYEADYVWDGNNNISRATGSQWEHEELYHTEKGAWVLKQWSNRQGSITSWDEIDAQSAAKWLVKNGHECDMIKDDIEKLEI